MKNHNDYIHLKDVRTHNLKGIELAIPLRKLTVVTGVSGSGKSSLVFDTLYGESYRRYLESLSSFARQYLEALPKPKVGEVLNLPPAIAVKQQRKGANKRSTVGTLTEAFDFIQTLYSTVGQLFCPACNRLIKSMHPGEVFASLLDQQLGKRLTLTASITHFGNISNDELLDFLQSQGFTRLMENGSIRPIEDLVQVKDLSLAEVVVDRFKVDEGSKGRILESLNLGFRVGKGRATVWDGQGKIETFSKNLECIQCDKQFTPPSPSSFSFNNPLGACSKCQGYGEQADIDWDKVFPDHSMSIGSEGIAALNFGQHKNYYHELASFAESAGIATDTPFSKYGKPQWNWLKFGDQKTFHGMMGYFDWLDTKKYKPHYRMHKAKFVKYTTCLTCDGSRYSQQSLSYRLQGLNISQVQNLSIGDLLDWTEKSEASIKSASNQDAIVIEAVSELKLRLRYLCKIGLSYLNLGRSSVTLSGGELQRIHMARCLGSSLTDALFCLDEPTAGLHARDSEKLLELLLELRDKGNTVVVVEHDEIIIKGAEKCIEIGPGAGHEGGELLDSCAQQAVLKTENTGPFRPTGYLHLTGAKAHNLKGDSLEVPTSSLTVVCGGSGSGKSSLIESSLYPVLAKALGQPAPNKTAVDLSKLSLSFKGKVDLNAVCMVSQAPLGRSSRSNIVTYLGIYTQIRKLMAEQPQAKKLGLSAGAFSFNVAGGRCEECSGMGTVVQDMSFLGEMDIVCPVCNGKRFKDEVLTVSYKGLNLNEILSLTAKQARSFFCDIPKITKVLDEVEKLGLGYISLGQATSSFSGGEAQRLKLLSVSELNTKSQTVCLILDAPSTGLASSDVANFIKYIRDLTKRGHTVIIVEHNLDVIRSADFVVELGPGPSQQGGRIVFQGPKEKFLKYSQSVTLPYL